MKAILPSSIVFVVAAVSFSPSATAYCDLLSYTGRGLSEEDALQDANNKGLVRVHQLDKQYGKRVKYNKATWKCSGADHVTCTVTQRYCIAGLDGR